MKKRILSVLLCLVMVLGLLPTAAFAAEESGATTGSGTKDDPYCVSTYDELLLLLRGTNDYNDDDVYIKVVGMDDSPRYLKYGTDYGYGVNNGGTALIVYGKKHLEIPKGIRLEFIADGSASYKNRLNTFILVHEDAELYITGEGYINVEFNHLGTNNIIKSRGKLTIDGNVLFDGRQDNRPKSWCSPIEVTSGQTIINGGSFYAYNGMGPGTNEGFTSAVWVEGGSLTINGGEFRAFGDLSSRDESTGERRVWPLTLGSGKSQYVTLRGGSFSEGMRISGGIANVLEDGYQLLSLNTDKDNRDYRLLGDAELAELKEIENRVIVVSKVGLTNPTLTANGTPINAVSGKTATGTIAAGDSGKTFTVSVDSPKWLTSIVDEGHLEYRTNFLVMKGSVPLSSADYTIGEITVTEQADGTSKVKFDVTLTNPPAAGEVYTVAAVVQPVAWYSDSTTIGDPAIGTWTLTTEAAPPEPVAHTIKISNTWGTVKVNDVAATQAYAGDTVTVTATDRTGDNLMFTQWYTDTSGVTFKDANKQTTTFTMPDYAVSVYPGFQSVGFTKQPASKINLQTNYAGTAQFAFSWDITKWELVDTSTNETVSESEKTISAGTLTKAAIPANDTNDATKTYRIVVTTPNGEKFRSEEITVKWLELEPAPLVDFTVASGTKFFNSLEVGFGFDDRRAGNLLSPYTVAYTTNLQDPMTATEGVTYTKQADVHLTLDADTTIKARTFFKDEHSGEITAWGDLCEASYEKVTTLPTPTVIPESQSYSGGLPITMTALDVYNAKIFYDVTYGDGKSRTEEEYKPSEGFTIPWDYGGTTTLNVYTRIWRDGGGADDSAKATYTYTRLYWANIDDVTVSGKADQAITETDVTIKLDGEKFKDVAAGNDVSDWFTNRPAGLTATVKSVAALGNELTVTISGTPTATSAETITVKIPAANLTYNTAEDLTVLSNPKAYYSIGADDTHEHDFTGQPWIVLDDDFHYQLCKSNDASNLQPHSFGSWTPDASDANKHYKECSDCGHKVSAAHNESSHITDTPAGIGTEGAWHTKCLDCGKQMNSGTLEALTKIDVANLTVAKPVKGVACADATTTDTTYTVAYTEWLDNNGDPLNAGESFKAGTIYTAKITLEGSGSNVFSANSSYNEIEGKTATVSPDLTGSEYAYSVVLTYTFDATAGDYVPVAPTITTTTLPGGKVGETYSALLEATGDKPITWSVDSGDLPDGLTLVGDTIKGTPSKAGSFTFTVKASNTAGSATQAFTVAIADADTTKYHTVTLSGAGIGATGAGSHAANTTVNIYAGTKSGYTFAGWTSDDVTVLSASDKNASFAMPDKDVTVKANWTYNGGGSGGGGYTYYTIKATAGVNGSISPSGNVSVREGRDQTFTITPNKGYAVARVLIDSKNVGAVKSYTFENVKKAHTIEVVFMKSSGNPQTGVFVDVPEGSYYEEAVNWAVEQGITQGTDATHFSPDGICTRAQAVTFLWRAAGSPAPKTTTMPFTDVPAGSYYYDAVLWAVENGITKGTTDTTFSPNMNCSRAQIVTFLWRSEQSPAAGTVNPFTDVKSDAYYADAVLWAVKEDVTKGTTATTFSPDANCTRAQIVTFIYRALAE